MRTAFQRVTEGLDPLCIIGVRQDHKRNGRERLTERQNDVRQSGIGSAIGQGMVGIIDDDIEIGSSFRDAVGGCRKRDNGKLGMQVLEGPNQAFLAESIVVDKTDAQCVG